MKELSLHILDLAENSTKANANLIKITIEENLEKDILILSIEDNGVGMENELLKKVTDPFVTTRKTRKVGLGLSLMKSAALRCEGDFKITSQKGIGTSVYCSFKHSHIDRAPLGNMGETIASIINYNSGIDLYYKHIFNNRQFEFDTREVKKILDEVDIRSNEIILWIKAYINEKIKEIYTNK